MQLNNQLLLKAKGILEQCTQLQDIAEGGVISIEYRKGTTRIHVERETFFSQNLKYVVTERKCASYPYEASITFNGNRIFTLLTASEKELYSNKEAVTA